jgi:hypothetical protein
MAKLFVYGCSFSDEYLCQGWPTMLRKQLGMELQNAAVGSGSSENAMIRFQESVRRDEIQDGDIVIMQLTTVGRLHLRYQRQFPATASQFLHDMRSDHPHHVWYKQHQSNLEWYLLNRDDKLLALNREAYIHVMLSYAQSFPNRTVVLLQNSMPLAAFPLFRAPTNFLMPQLDLQQISEAEIVDLYARGGWHWWCQHTFCDFRDMHLTVPNLQTLADQLYRAIQTHSVEDLTADKFLANVCVDRIDSADRYLEYVDRGLIAHADRKVQCFLR